jgi:hypothetical protein
MKTKEKSTSAGVSEVDRGERACVPSRRTGYKGLGKTAVFAFVGGGPNRLRFVGERFTVLN